MIKVLIISVLILSLPVIVHGQYGMPSYTDVVKKFYTTYDVSDQGMSAINFERRQSGWYVATVDISKGYDQAHPSKLFWDKQSRQYKNLQFAKAIPDFPWEQYIDTVRRYEFSVHRFYGYRGWYNDVIRYYDLKKSLSDSMYFSLARAHSYRALCMMYAIQDAARNETFKLPLTRNCINQAQMLAYQKEMKTSIGYLEKIYKRNPDFQTRWGSIYTKYSNEFMWLYQFTLFFKTEEEANKLLTKPLYSDSILRVSRELLNSCDKPGLLITFDDNDYYPLLYLQAYERLKRDVYLIVYNGLCIDRFISILQYDQFSAPQIKFSFDTSFYKGSRNDVIIFGDDTMSIKYQDLVRRLEVNSDAYPRFSSNRIMIEDGHVLEIDPPYLIKCQFMLLDILNNNKERSVYFTKQIADFPTLNQFLIPWNSLWRWQ